MGGMTTVGGCAVNRYLAVISSENRCRTPTAHRSNERCAVIAEAG